MTKRDEEEIMENWKGNLNKPEVSIKCLTYNHENYISKTIDGFLMQKTEFPFEVIINDDCSTDRTADIIREYEKKYPNIIKPVYQTENKFSQGKKHEIGSTLNKLIQGKYIALCEGDDYWTDPEKLQIQVDLMQKNPDVDMSFHPSRALEGERLGKILARHSDKNKIFTTAEVILGDGGFCPTASLIFRQKVLLNLPQWFYSEAPVGDYFMQIFGSLNNGALYIDRNMSIYRKGGAWSNSQRESEKMITWFKRIKNCLNELDKETSFKYSKELNLIINRYSANLIENINVDIDYRKNIYLEIIEQLSIWEKTKWYFIFSKPFVYKTLKYFKNKVIY